MVELHSSRTRGQKLVMSLVYMFFIYLSYKSKMGPKAYVIAILLVYFLNLYVNSEGISSKGVIFSTGRGINKIVLLDYEEIDILKLKIRDNIRLEAQGENALAVMYFKKEDLERLEGLIAKVKVQLQ